MYIKDNLLVMVDEIDQISKNLKMIIYATYHGC